MKTLSKLFLASLILFTIVSCKKSDDGGDGGSATEGTLTAKVNGTVFTSSDNFYDLEEYLVSNISLDYKIGKIKPIMFGFQVLNLENKPYQNVLSRPMPGRNYMINLTFNF